MFSKIHFCGGELEPYEINILKETIDKENGVFQTFMDEDVSYYITRRVGSKNYFIAREQKAHIVLPEWVSKSVEKQLLENVDDYSLMLFEGIIATSTGFNMDERYAMQEQIELHGGFFKRELVTNRTTYLIARSVDSEKYRAASSCSSITIVNEYWLEDSVRCKSIQNPSNYQNYTNSKGLRPISGEITRIPSAFPSSGNQHTTFSESSVAMIQPLEEDYLTPNKTIARTREVDMLFDGYIVFMCIQDDMRRKQVTSILCCHGAFCIDLLIPSTNVVIADSIADYRSVTQTIHDTEALAASLVTNDATAAPTDFITSNSTDVDLSYIPIVNAEWVLDSHSQYKVCAYDSYLWKNGLFSGIQFFIYEFKRDYDVVKKTIEDNDGKIVSDMSEATAIVCPRTVNSDIYMNNRAVSSKWIKACLESKKVVSRTAHVLFRPLPCLLQGKTIVLTGFSAGDKDNMESYIVALGGKLENAVKNYTFALICDDNVRRNVKTVDAEENGVCIKEMVPIDDYIFKEKKERKEESTVGTHVKDTQLVSLQSTVNLSAGMLTQPIPSVSDARDPSQPVYNSLASEVVAVEKTSVAKPSRTGSVGSTTSHDSLYMVDCRSNSVHESQDKRGDETGISLFGEKKEKEVIYTSFSDVMFSNDNTVTRQKDGKLTYLAREKAMQQASKVILSPSERKPLADSKKLLDNVTIATAKTPPDVNIFNRWSKTGGQKIMLDMSGVEENPSLSNLGKTDRVSLTAMSDDEIPDVAPKPYDSKGIMRGRKKKKETETKPKSSSKAKTPRKTTRTKKK